MKRLFATVVVAAVVGWPVAVAQEIVRVNHGSHHASAVVDGACTSGQCGTCNDCVRVPDIKSTKHPVYACTIKETCIPPTCLLTLLTGGKCGCTKVEIPQLIKKYRTDEEC